MAWPRPVPTVGDTTSSAQRAAEPRGWELPVAEREALHRIIHARRDIRRFRADPVPDDALERVLGAAHAAPSVGHSQPWRFVVVRDPITRQRAATLADGARLAQAAQMDDASARHLLDLDLEGLREAPLGIVVCCDRRAPAAGILGRATFPDADLWSCACAIQNLWLAARAEGLGVGWVTLFRPEELSELVAAPERVATLGWLCIGWPDERPPDPGLERRGWSTRQPLASVVVRERFPPDDGSVAAPPSHLRPPAAAAVVAAHDRGDDLLSPPGSLGLLDRTVDRVLALGPEPSGAALVLAGSDHPVAARGVSAYPASVTRHVMEAAVAGSSAGAVAARATGIDLTVVDAGVDGPPVEGALAARPRDPRGDIADRDGLSAADAARLVAIGRQLGSALAGNGQAVVLGEVGVGNTTVAAALAAGLLRVDGVAAVSLVGLGAGSDSAIVAAKRRLVEAAVARVGDRRDPWALLAALGGGELAVLAGVTLGAAFAGGTVILDGLATAASALVAVRAEPAVAAHLVAGQRSREAGHQPVLDALGLEPLIDLRLRAGEGAGGCLAAQLLLSGLAVRREIARVLDA